MSRPRRRWAGMWRGRGAGGGLEEGPGREVGSQGGQTPTGVRLEASALSQPLTWRRVLAAGRRGQARGESPWEALTRPAPRPHSSCVPDTVPTMGGMSTRQGAARRQAAGRRRRGGQGTQAARADRGRALSRARAAETEEGGQRRRSSRGHALPEARAAETGEGGRRRRSSRGRALSEARAAEAGEERQRRRPSRGHALSGARAAETTQEGHLRRPGRDAPREVRQLGDPLSVRATADTLQESLRRHRGEAEVGSVRSQRSLSLALHLSHLSPGHLRSDRHNSWSHSASGPAPAAMFVFLATGHELNFFLQCSLH